jgi:hypothetical protein
LSYQQGTGCQRHGYAFAGNNLQIVFLVITHLFHADIRALNDGTLADSEELNGTATTLDPSAQTSVVRVGEETPISDFLDG